MTDVMNSGVYPHDPLPGPLKKVDAQGPWHEYVSINGDVFRRDYQDTSMFLHRVPNPSPILEPPMYFPGANWGHSVTYG